MQAFVKKLSKFSLPSYLSEIIIVIALFPISGMASDTLDDCYNGKYVCTQPNIRYSWSTPGNYVYETGQAACDFDAAHLMSVAPDLVVTSNVYTSGRCLMTMYSTRVPEQEPWTQFVSTVYTGQLCDPEPAIRIYLEGGFDENLRAYPLLCAYTLYHHVVVPHERPQQQCSVGNPVEVSGGTKYQKEVDIGSKGIGQVSFERYYSSRNLVSGVAWHHNYDTKLLIVDSMDAERIKIKSIDYMSKSNACVTGWSQINNQVTDSWARNTSATLNGNLCQVKNTSGTVVKNLPIVSKPSQNVSITPSSVQILRADGSTIHFQYDGEGYSPLDGDKGILERPNAGEVMWRYSSREGDVEEYSADGKLTTVLARNGVKQILFYDSTTNLLSEVEDTAGGSLQFQYTNGLLTSVTTQDDKTTTYAYNASNLISDVGRPDNTHRQYHYEDTRFPTYLTGITDERGVRYATWTYDGQGRAVSSEHAGGTDKTLLAFNADGSTTVTNPLGKQTIYHFDDIAGARRVTQVEGHATTSCDGANQNYTYTPEGWLESKTDWKGNTTTYSYNTFGQEISRTEASGTPDERTITTEWHPDFYVKTRVVEGGKETLYTYDDNGRLLSTTTNPLPIQ